jgi:hypothetical protein
MHKLENQKSSRRRALSDVQGEGPSVALLRALLSRVLTAFPLFSLTLLSARAGRGRGRACSCPVGRRCPGENPVSFCPLAWWLVVFEGPLFCVCLLDSSSRRRIRRTQARRVDRWESRRSRRWAKLFRRRCRFSRPLTLCFLRAGRGGGCGCAGGCRCPGENPVSFCLRAVVGCFRGVLLSAGSPAAALSVCSARAFLTLLPPALRRQISKVVWRWLSRRPSRWAKLYFYPILSVLLVPGGAPRAFSLFSGIDLCFLRV